MQLESLACNNCGAPLQVPTTANYVTCNHCSTQLAVRRETSISYTEKIDQIGERTNHLVQELAQVRYQRALDAIDRQWERESKQYMIRGKHGHESLPSQTAAILFGIGAWRRVIVRPGCWVGGRPSTWRFRDCRFPRAGYHRIHARHKSQRIQSGPVTIPTPKAGPECY